MASKEDVVDVVIEAESKLQELQNRSHSLIDIKTVEDWLNRIKKAI